MQTKKNRSWHLFTVMGAMMSATALFGALPAGYTQLAFLESSGTQYIDTGVVFGKTNGFSITYAMVMAENENIYQAVCGSRNELDTDTRCLLYSRSTTFKRVYTNGLRVTSSPNIFSTTPCHRFLFLA